MEYLSALIASDVRSCSFRKVRFQSFSGSDVLACMVPSFCPPMVWAISLEFLWNPPFRRPTIS